MFRRGLRAAFYRSTAREAILAPARRLLLRGRVMTLMYHEVLDDDCGVDAWTVVRETDFARQMEYVRRHFATVSLEEAAEALRSGTRAALAAVTFDDGYVGNLRLALPVVESLGIPIAVFVATRAVATGSLHWFDRVILSLQPPAIYDVDLTAFGLRRYSLSANGYDGSRWTGIQQVLTDLKQLPDERRDAAVASLQSRAAVAPSRLRPLTVAELGTLARSSQVTIGAHSHCHGRLCRLGADALADTIGASKHLLENWTGRPVRAFSYPNGDYDERVVAAVRAQEFSLAVTTRPRPWSASDAPFEVPRVGIGRYDGWDRFRTIVSGVLL